MHRVWTLETARGTFLLCAAPSFAGAPSDRLCGRDEAAREVGRWLAGVADRARVAGAVVRLLAPGATAAAGGTSDRCREILSAVLRGRFDLWHRAPPLRVAPRERGAAEPLAVEHLRRTPRPELGWIEIELVDQGDHPVAGERYCVELADGDVRQGRLDGEGYAVLDSIPAGPCKVWFPDLHGPDWTSIGSSPTRRRERTARR